MGNLELRYANVAVVYFAFFMRFMDMYCCRCQDKRGETRRNLRGKG